MSTRSQQLFLHTLLAPSRLVSGVPMRNGYGMGIAATVAGSLTIQLPEFELAKANLVAAERALAAVEEAYDVWRWKPGGACTIAGRLRHHQEWLGDIRAVVAEGDHCLPALIRRGFVLTVTTSKDRNLKMQVAPKRFTGFPAPTYPYSAAVSVQRVP